MTDVGNNVVSLFAKREVKKDEPKDAENVDLLAIAEKNKKNAERVAAERLRANKGVLRSYRIKN